jgi:hypothetical protein
MYVSTQDWAQPDHWDLLSSDDAQAYLELSRILNESSTKSSRGQKIDSFTERLTKIRAFIERDEADSWKRSLVCGVFFPPDGLVLHIRQFRVLMGRCKSSINGSLQEMGYSAQTHFPRLDNSCFPRVPDRHIIGELRSWTLRKKIEKEPFIIPIPKARSVTEKSEESKEQIAHNFPCPVKWRYKFCDTINSIRGNQTDGSLGP